MKIPLVIASGQGIIPLVLIGLPAALIGIVCLGASAFLAFMKQDPDRKNRGNAVTVGGVGIFLIVLAFFSPAIGGLFGL